MPGETVPCPFCICGSFAQTVPVTALCVGGCVGGPSAFKDQMVSRKDRDALIGKADGRDIIENLSHFDQSNFSMHRTEHAEGK